MALRNRFRLELPIPPVVSIIGSGQRRTLVEDGIVVERYPAAYDRGEGLAAELKHALRHEPLHLGILDLTFRAADPIEIETWVSSEPTGVFSRRAWFLYEPRTGERLNLPDAGGVANAPVLDLKSHIALPNGEVSRRHRIINNLLGVRGLCPVVRRTPRLVALMRSGIADEARAMVEGCDPAVLMRAVSYLYTKETKSTFEIENEVVGGDRAQRFIAALRLARDLDPSSMAELVRLQNLIVDPRYAEATWRSIQNFVGETVGGYRELVHFVCPRPADVPSLMDAFGQMAKRLSGVNELDAVVAAAVQAFAFVFIHPFEDGNGRIHRFLVHHVLAEAGFTPAGVLLPISAAMVRNRTAYDEALESFSKSVMPYIRWRLDRDETGNLIVENETVHLYRFFDATPLAEYLYGALTETVRKDLREELDFIDIYDRGLAAVRSIIDMPDRRASLLVRLMLQNQGNLAKRRRDKEFCELTEHEVTQLEIAMKRVINGEEGPEDAFDH